MKARTKRRLRRGLALCLLTPLAALAAFFVLDARYPFPIEQLQSPESPSLLAADGTPLRVLLNSDEQWRQPIPLGRISPWLVKATIAVEDHRFYDHIGVDPLAILRAALQNLAGARTVSGASTLSMQLVKMTSPPGPRNLWSKAREAFRALQLERLRSKQEILELYLNLAPYVGNYQGAECASLALFGKHAADLSMDEAMLLAGLPQSPTRYAPGRHLQRALARRSRVLDASVRAGQMDAASADQVRASVLILDRAARPDLAPHFAGMAFRRRPAGGRSTLDAGLQQQVEELVHEHARGLPRGADVAVCIIELKSAGLRALVGSADVLDPVDGRVNGATAWRSPGSALKPFIYAAAFEAHLLDPESPLDDTPINLGGWRPNNFDGGFAGQVSVREALRRSLNIPALRAARLAGLHRVIGVIESCGVRLPTGVAQHAGLSIATGGAAVRLLDLTNAYATLGRDGLFVELRLFEDEPRQAHRVLCAETCQALHSILDSAERIPGARPNAPRFCWKTGTSSGMRDAWALGHNHEYALGVWVGNFSGAGHANFVGSEVAAPLLALLMERL